MSIDNEGYFAINREMERQAAQRESVKGKDKSFRVEFRFRHGTRHWEYYTCLKDAENAPDSKRCYYSIFGSAMIERPTSKQIQMRGPRGGWSKYKKKEGV